MYRTLLQGEIDSLLQSLKSFMFKGKKVRYGYTNPISTHALNAMIRTSCFFFFCLLKPTVFGGRLRPCKVKAIIWNSTRNLQSASTLSCQVCLILGEKGGGAGLNLKAQEIVCPCRILRIYKDMEVVCLNKTCNDEKYLSDIATVHRHVVFPHYLVRLGTGISGLSGF